MSTEASLWHQNRGKLILKEGLDLGTVKASIWTKLSLILVPLLHIGLCVLSKYLTVAQIFALSYAVGALCVMYIFSNAHEIFHGMISSRLQHPRFKNLFLRFATMLDLTPGLYFYYKYGHAPHHFSQGGNSLAEIEDKLFDEKIDFDAMTNFKNIYKFRAQPGEKAAYRFPAIEHNRLLRILVLFLMPLIDTIVEVGFEPLRFYNWYREKRSPEARRILRDLLSQALLMFLVKCAIAWAIHDLRFLLYLFLSRIFFLGFVHPYGLLWIAIHRAEEDAETYQPATSLTGRLETFLCAGINLHVEHHDLPWVSRGSLGKVKEKFPEYYTDLKHFEGFGAVMKFVVQKDYDNRYSEA